MHRRHNGLHDTLWRLCSPSAPSRGYARFNGCLEPSRVASRIAALQPRIHARPHEATPGYRAKMGCLHRLWWAYVELIRVYVELIRVSTMVFWAQVWRLPDLPRGPPRGYGHFIDTPKPSRTACLAATLPPRYTQRHQGPTQLQRQNGVHGGDPGFQAKNPHFGDSAGLCPPGGACLSGGGCRWGLATREGGGDV